MPRKKWIDKKSATTFALVHRAQDDPRIHDADSSSRVFKEVSNPNRKGKSTQELEDELKLAPDAVRANEGEAANFGIYYDDSEYDYMQHLRDLGASTEAQFVEAPQQQNRQKSKGKQRLEDALRDSSLEDDASGGGVRIDGTTDTQLFDEDISPSKPLKKGTYQDQQDIPDALAGFQPDMDPRLREVLEALEDDAYVDKDDDIFKALANKSEEVSQEEFGDAIFDDEDMQDGDGWETDDTTKPDHETLHPSKNGAGQEAPGAAVAASEDGDWMAEFRKFKKDTKSKAKVPPAHSELQSSILTGSSVPGKLKKRKGAMTSSTGYSMTSSALARTEGQSLLDDRFDKIEEEYADDDDDGFDDGVSLAASTVSTQGPIRSDFDSMMDDFLGSHSMAGRKRVKKGGYQTGMQQLDEIRKDLGPAKFKSQKA